MAVAPDPEPAGLHPLSRLGGGTVRRVPPGTRPGPDATDPPDLPAGGERSPSQPVALYPSGDIDRVHADLLKAGLTGSLRAEEFVAIQVGAVLLGFGTALIALVTGAIGVKFGVALLFMLPIIGGLVPSYWLRHRIKRARCR